MYQFFVEPEAIQGKTVMITGEDVNHIKNVLRMKPGEEISVKCAEERKEYRCGIEEITEEMVRCTLYFIKEDGVELPSSIYLFQGLPKADKMEMIIQKAVELGVCEIIPMATKRAVVKLDEKKAAAKVSRWQAISEAAAKQSKRAYVPKIHLPMSFSQALEYAKTKEVKFIPYEMAEGMDCTRKLIEDILPGQEIAVFIGPEGGFEEKEIEAAKKQGIQPITLGKRILRTETAGLTVLAWLMYRLEGKNIL